MFRHMVPKTLLGQLIAMLACVLSVAQAINLTVLVGSQRLQARSIAHQAAIEHAARLIANLPEDLSTDFPLILRKERGGPQGAFFLSANNRAEPVENTKTLARYNARFAALLAAEGLTPLQTSVIFSPQGPGFSGRNNQRESRLVATTRGQKGRPPLKLQNGLYPPPHGRGRPPGFQGRPLNGRHLNERPLKGPGFSGAGKSPLQEIRISAEIKDGVWFNAMIPHAATESFTGRILLATGLLLGLSLLAAWIFARRISRPLSNFTKAAERLGRGEDPDPLSETGPVDMRQAAYAFNIMQARLTRMLESQRTMLRAVGHDLRTPLTSLRLRAENIDDAQEKKKVISTLDDMTVMTEEILGWAKDASGTETLASVDLGSLLQSLTDDYQDLGRDVALKDFKTFPITIRRISIKRALQNLINNALQYGQSATLSVECQNNKVIIHVDDRGPGVPEDQLIEILKPFIRLETSRSRETGGTGLGLSNVETIAQIHGGRLVLTNLKPKGLRASLSLPL